jgi:putative phosphoesterase
VKIGLISDTHGDLDPLVSDYFGDCDEIWHAGDIGTAAVADQLEKLKPFRAVYGNVDDATLRARFPEDLRFTCEGVTVVMTHIGGTPPSYSPHAKKLFSQGVPDLFICGHSHILRVKRDVPRNLLFLNPGAAGNHGFHTLKTLLRFEIAAGKVTAMEAIELGKRGQLPRRA